MASVVQIREQYRKSSRVNPVAAPLPKTGRVRRRELEAQLASLKRQNDDLTRALYEAAQVQRTLCGPRSFRTASYEVASEIFPVRHLSGDFITVMQFEGDLVFAIGDIEGKGLRAAMWFTHMVGMIRREISTHADPATALSAVDRDLLLSGLEFPLTTLFLARLKLATGELTYCNAGHPASLLLRENGEVEKLSEGGPVLGVISGAAFVNGSTFLSPNDTLLAYSDGIADCRNEAGLEFGTERLLGTAKACSGSGPGAMLFSILAAVQNFLGTRPREDDIALMVVRRLNS